MNEETEYWKEWNKQVQLQKKNNRAFNSGWLLSLKDIFSINELTPYHFRFFKEPMKLKIDVFTTSLKVHNLKNNKWIKFKNIHEVIKYLKICFNINGD